MTTISMAELIRSGKTASYVDDKKMMRILEEINDEVCEGCGEKTISCGPLLAKDTKDELDRNIVKMVCSHCMKQKPKRRSKK